MPPAPAPAAAATANNAATHATCTATTDTPLHRIVAENMALNTNGWSAGRKPHRHINVTPKHLTKAASIGNGRHTRVRTKKQRRNTPIRGFLRGHTPFYPWRTPACYTLLC